MCCPVQGVPRAGDQWCAAQGDSERVRTLRRTDLYVCVSHAIGAKARGSVSAAEIEFKHRVQRKKRGAELVFSLSVRVKGLCGRVSRRVSDSWC